MEKLDHSNIVELYQFATTDNHLFLVMEYIPGQNVFQYLHLYGEMNEDDARIYFRFIVLAIDYLHRKKIVHRYYSIQIS